MSAVIVNDDGSLSFVDDDGVLHEKLKPWMLEFNAKNHSYTIKGTKHRVSSVTTILNALSKSSLIIWSAKCAADKTIELVKEGVDLSSVDHEELHKELMWAHKNAADDGKNTGTLVHEAVEMYLTKGRITKKFNNELESDFDAAMCFDSFKDWLKEDKRKMMHVEKRLIESSGLYCGTLDLVYSSSRGVVLADFKATKRSKSNSIGVYSSYIMQMAAYARAFEQETGIKVDDIELVSLGKDGTCISTFHSDLQEKYDIPSVERIGEVFIDLIRVHNLVKSLDSCIGKAHRLHLKEFNNNVKEAVL